LAEKTDCIERKDVLKILLDTCEACIDACDDGYGTYTDCGQCVLNGVKTKIREVPAYAVNRIVTCSECKNFNLESGGDYCCTREAEEDERIPGLYYGFVEYHEPDFFCAYGERRENEK